MSTKHKTTNLPSTVVGRRRLLKLAALLEADAKNKKGIRFDLGTWGTADPDNDDGKLSVSCGTTACAMGLAALSRKFSGLRHQNDSGDLTFVWRGQKSFDGINIAQELFEISSDAAEWLFYEDSYYETGPTEGARAERAVAKRIRDFVAGKVVP